MILTCPECATSYFVDDSRIPPGGRMVKCTSCAARWRAELEPTATPAEVEAPAPAPKAAPEVVAEAVVVAEAAAAPEPAPAAAAVAPEDDLEISGPEETGLRKRPARPPSTAPTIAPKQQATRAIIAWSLMAAIVAALVTGAIVFRADVVRLWPQSSDAYAGVGLPVNTLGLVIEQVKVGTPFQGGRPVLSVTGAVRNVSSHAAEAPALRIDILDKAGEPVTTKIVRPIDARVPAGARRYFAIAISDPPSSAHDVQVAFEADAKPEGRSEATAHTAEAAPAHAPAPAAVEAQPLPADSPEALHDHG